MTPAGRCQDSPLETRSGFKNGSERPAGPLRRPRSLLLSLLVIDRRFSISGILLAAKGGKQKNTIHHLEPRGSHYFTV